MGVLDGRVAVVTGAGRGIGSEIASELAKAGASVVVNYARSEEGANALVRKITEEGLIGIAVKADVSQLDDIEQMIAFVKDHFGGIDILVNNAAVDPTEDFFHVTESFWETVVHTNFKGTFFCSQVCAKAMKERGKGRIVNISSVHGQATMPDYAVYASTKGAINALTRQLAIDLAPYGITVNAVAPGATEVEKFVGQDWYDPVKIGSYIPLGRIGKPSDVAPLVRFLASNEADFITGQVITIDGGTTTKLFLPIEVDQKMM